MKNKLFLSTLAIVTAMSMLMAGCGSSKTESTSSSTSSVSGTSVTVDNTDENDLTNIPTTDKDVANKDCVTLADYKNMELTKQIDEITDENAKAYAEAMKETTEVTDENKAVENGDFVDIAFKGTIDGKEFDGGSSDSYELEIGSGSMIPGFEDGIVGMKKGEEKDLNLKFPEDYGGEDISGKDVVFHVTVNKISMKEEPTEEEIADAKKTLEENNKELAESNLSESAWTKILDGSKVTQFRKADIDKEVETLKADVDKYLKETGETMEQYIEETGQTQESYDRNMQEYARENVREDMITAMIGEAEGISKEDDEQNKKLEELAAEYGLTKDEFLKQYGESTIQRYIFRDRILEKVVSYAKITEEKTEALPPEGDAGVEAASTEDAETATSESTVASEE